MTVIPLLVRVAEQNSKEKVALMMAWPGYIWMGFLFIFISTLLTTDAIHYSYHLVTRKCFKQLPTEAISSRYTCIIVLLVSVCASIYSCFEAGRIHNEHVVISTPKLPSSISRIRIVQVSDVHIGLLLREQRLERIIEQIKQTKPDILVSTGDLIDGKLNRDDAMSGLLPLAAMLATISTPSGKFAVTGNHEVYAGLPQAQAFSRAAGLTMLRNESVQLANGIDITGIDDSAVNPSLLAAPVSETALLSSVARDQFSILLKHRPDILPQSDGQFDLQLSGHVHGGQIFPFNFLVKLKHPVPCGISTTKAGSQIYVSRGTGTWGPPMRLFAPPEITIIDIVHQPRKTTH